MHSETDKDGPDIKETFTGRDVLYREGAVGLLDVQRAADALLRQGRKPSVAAIREHLGGGSPNTITPLLAKYWEKLGSRLGDGPESLERVPEALARVTELLWRRAIEEAREHLKILQSPKRETGVLEELQEHVGKLSVSLAEARAREGEHLTQLGALSRALESERTERRNLIALLKATQVLGDQQASRLEQLAKRQARPASKQPRLKSVKSLKRTVAHKGRKSVTKRRAARRKSRR